jgi:hypothetical protein
MAQNCIKKNKFLFASDLPQKRVFGRFWLDSITDFALAWI